MWYTSGPHHIQVNDMFGLIGSLVGLIFNIALFALNLVWTFLCVVIWIMWGVIFGFSVGARPINVGPFRAE
jgi:hypothetical protein